MSRKRIKMKVLLVLLAVALLCISVSACGGVSKNTVSVSAVPQTVTVGGTATAEPATQRSKPVPRDDRLTGGHEATEPDKREITALVNRYYAAAVADNGTVACTLLTSAMVKSVPEDYGQNAKDPALRGTTCSVVMSKLFKHPYGVSVEDLATTKVTGAHIHGNRGFARLHSSMMPTGEIGVEREHGSWKINVPIGAVN